MSSTSQLPIQETLTRGRLQRLPLGARWALLALLITSCLYLVSPYITLWRLNFITVNGPTSALSSVVNIEAVHEQIQRRLNKEHDSAIGEVSDAFIDWIQEAIRRDGADALSHTVTLSWLRQLLLTHAEGGDGFRPAIHYAFYTSPTGFRVQIGDQTPSPEGTQEPQTTPVHLRLGRTWLGWRVIAAYY
ncbi:hypothetical protein CKO42_23620 [Lamprobacter modestohalophilus]|uniref:DUF2939 domain-containing protein n=1 Tax=Lamprobacter modestohalophilus TaxID=1064514 RepID=A0A9X1B722_9GAMM|nr:DUF2939 domain-containing protein [Lamprobacter modestohalophilus]MBK1621347.1 hypothetical protein [Lamprobacter modestohalophilus]MCF8004784.1 DUF2939 domain-containing protein [Chromatiaceae bacterium]